MIEEISARELLTRLESAGPPQVLDIRAPARARRGHIESGDYLNLPGSQLIRLADPAAAGLDRARPVAVVCDLGNSSRQIAAWLGTQGYRTASLAGGMRLWMRAVAAREVPGIQGLERLIQFDRVGKGALGYLAIARPGTNGRREALAIDPGRDLEPWLAALAAGTESGAQLVAVVDTHCHADYLSGGPELARLCGAPYRIHAADARDPYDLMSPAPARWPYTPLVDGESIAVGDTCCIVEEMPGHTEGSVALRLGDELAFTGDVLFVDSIGRPDLADRTAEWTGLLWGSLQRLRHNWPVDLRVFPAHYSSDDERAAQRIVEGRLGSLRERNVPFAIADEASFRSWIAQRVGEFPDAYRSLKHANLGLIEIDEELADELEAGKNQCALAC